MKTWKRIAALLLSISMTLSFAACGTGESEDVTAAKEITIAYQGGIGYAPVHILEEKGLIQENYDGEVTVTFVKLDSGAAINEGIIGGTIDIGCMGLAPAVSGVAAGIPYKAISNLCSQSHGLMSNDPAITKLSDITSGDKISLVNTGYIQHILLAMAAEKEFGDPHALDNNIQAMSHAEGMASLESGTVKLHLTSSPFIYQERDSGKYTELAEIREVWPSGSTFLVAMAADSLAQDAALFEAVNKAFAQAIAFLNENPEETVQIEAEYLQLDAETVTGYLNQEDCQFFSEVRGVESMISFMYRAGFTTKEITMEDFLYDTTGRG